MRAVSTKRSANSSPADRGRDLDHFDARTGQHGVERGRELSRAIANQEPEQGDVFAEVHHEVVGLLGDPGSVGMRGYAQDVQMAIANLECEQDVDPPERHRAVDVEEVDGERAGGLGAPELSPGGVGVPNRCRWDAVALEDPADRRGGDAVAEFEQLALHSAVSQFGFSVAIRTTSAAMRSLIGGRPGRFG